MCSENSEIHKMSLKFPVFHLRNTLIRFQITLQRSLGFAVASEVYYQPADEEQYRKAVASVSDVAKDSFQEERERAWKTSNLLIPLKSIARSPSYNKMPSSHVEKDMGFSHDVEISQSL